MKIELHSQYTSRSLEFDRITDVIKGWNLFLFIKRSILSFIIVNEPNQNTKSPQQGKESPNQKYIKRNMFNIAGQSMSYSVDITLNTRDEESMEIGNMCMDISKDMVKTRTYRTREQKRMHDRSIITLNYQIRKPT